MSIFSLKNASLIFSVICLLAFVGCTKPNNHNVKSPNADIKGDEKPLPNEVDPDKVPNWFTKGPSESVEGVDAEKAYKDFKIQLDAKDVIVAVIDSGVDINHEDLKGKIWTNELEEKGLPGVDDDNNGYVDDIHGWNFIGGIGRDGKLINIGAERLEVTRELARLRKLKADLEGQNLALSPADQKLFEKVEAEVTKSRKLAEDNIPAMAAAIAAIRPNYEILKAKLNVAFEKLLIENVLELKPSNETETAAKDAILKVFVTTQSKSIERLQINSDRSKDELAHAYNEDFNPRPEIVKNDPDDFSQLQYGNNDVTGPDATHGTHVSGIIGAVRDNGIGINGIATSVKIMAVRAVPHGDEEDKDIYLAVKYAVDNGAQVINMSFGKSYSPHKAKLDEIFKYAADKGVIIVHAAGNSAEDNDISDNFPNRYVKNSDSTDYHEIKTWIEVGASTRYNDRRLVAYFSNYGQNGVDIFAPGFEIESTIPEKLDGDKKIKYAILSGTSMACPAVTGVVALVISQQPELKAEQIRNVVLQTARYKGQFLVNLPGQAASVENPLMRPFADFSRTGAIADAYAALKRLLTL